MSQQASTTLEGLPKRFVFAMRKLFDILDEKRIGYVKFSGEFNGSNCLVCNELYSDFKFYC